MNSYNYGVSAILDVKRVLDDEVRASLEAALRNKSGVKQAQFSPFVPRLVLVNYDAQATSAGEIRQTVHEVLETDGPATCLIGM